jgi:hypothetical protein
MVKLETSDQLLALFGDIASAGYLKPIHLSDTKVGFSIQRAYPKEIRYKPARNKAGEDDNIAVIWVVYEDKKPQGDGLIPIRLRIAMMSKYRAAHWDYDFEDPESPTKESVLESKKSPQPLDLSLSGEFFYDKENGRFVNSSNEVVSGVQILNAMFDEHCDTVHFIKGLRHRSQKKFDDLIRTAFDSLINAQVWVLRSVFGRTLQERANRSSFLDGYLTEDCRKSNTSSMTLAGYSASHRTIFLYCTLVVILCLFILPAKEDTYVGTLVRSEFLMLIHTIFALVILDEVLPWLVFYKLNLLIKVRKWNFNRLLKKSL